MEGWNSNVALPNLFTCIHGSTGDRLKNEILFSPTSFIIRKLYVLGISYEATLIIGLSDSPLQWFPNFSASRPLCEQLLINYAEKNKKNIHMFCLFFVLFQNLFFLAKIRLVRLLHLHLRYQFCNTRMRLRQCLFHIVLNCFLSWF